jgi:hypothetical protein
MSERARIGFIGLGVYITDSMLADIDGKTKLTL